MLRRAIGRANAQAKPPLKGKTVLGETQSARLLNRPNTLGYDTLTPGWMRWAKSLDELCLSPLGNLPSVLPHWTRFSPRVGRRHTSIHVLGPCDMTPRPRLMWILRELYSSENIVRGPGIDLANLWICTRTWPCRLSLNADKLFLILRSTFL